MSERQAPAAEKKAKTYVCNTCGNVFQSSYVPGPVKCRNPKCGDTLYQKMQGVILKYEPQIRKVVKLNDSQEIVLEHLKKFCAEIFWNDIHIYHDKWTLEATLDRLSSINIIDIPYNFNQ
ncbi:Conserved_hypothetical protein [Hexamita inflata]|uniref:Uncharacterized protein n=1 Tax=Hexamita inflata TaxID=28002 RepID=A0AA86PJY3_9EUKA|nr:Conserved hypothetical protein [Hexamita inflata]CAI9941220.1 Conserved hypothetical protein [Hexamita inflata]